MLTVLVNTAIYGAGALILSLTLGAIIAFLVERTDIPFRSTIYSAMLVSLAVPTMLKAFGWVLLLSPGLGWINYLLRQSFGMEGGKRATQYLHDDWNDLCHRHWLEQQRVLDAQPIVPADEP